MYCLPICKEDPDEHIGNIFLSGGIEHGSKGNELLGLHLLYLLDLTNSSMNLYEIQGRRNVLHRANENTFRRPCISYKFIGLGVKMSEVIMSEVKISEVTMSEVKCQR